METVDRIFELANAQFKEQREFAKAINVDPSIVSQWRTGVTKSYERRLRLNKIADVLGTTADYLLTGENKASTTPEGVHFTKPDFLVKFESLDPDDQQEVIAIIEYKASHKKKP